MSQRIPQIERLTLPAQYPSDAAMKSHGRNKDAYHPDFWELEYMGYRYLSGASISDLEARYKAIVRNMRSLLRSCKDVLPQTDVRSPWYWYRKEHLTRLEFALRNIVPISEEVQAVKAIASRQPFVQSQVHLNSFRIFKYGNINHLRDFVARGFIRIAPAQTYDNENLNAAQRDDELRKHSFIPKQYARVTTEKGASIPLLSDIKRTTNGPNYHLLCCSTEWDANLFADFGDTCATINDIDEFAQRIFTAGHSAFPGWLFEHLPVQYFDPYEAIPN